MKEAFKIDFFSPKKKKSTEYIMYPFIENFKRRAYKNRTDLQNGNAIRKIMCEVKNWI